MATDQVYQQSERIADTLQPWLNSFPVASNFVKRRKVERIGERGYFIPFKLQEAGRYGTVDTDGGDPGRGNNSKGDRMQSSSFVTVMKAELSRKQKDATSSRDVSMVSLFNDTVDNLMKHFAQQEDFSFHADGTALMGTASSHTTTGGKTVYTMETNIGVQRIRRGQVPVIYSTGYGAIRSTSLYVEKVDYGTREVTMSGTVPSAADTDIFCFEGVTGTGSAPSWKQGLGYFINSSTSSTILGISQANEPEMKSNSINVNGILNWQAGMALRDRIDDRRPGDGVAATSNQMIGLANRAQRAQMMLQVVQLSEWDRSRDPKAFDLAPDLGMEKYPWCGLDVYIDPQMDKSKLMFWNPKKWGKAQIAKLQWYEVGGQRFFPLHGASGAPAMAEWMGMYLDENYFCEDIATTGLLYGLSLPTNY